MHSSSVVPGSRRKRGTPRNLGASSGFSLGYSIVMCGLKKFFRVIDNPWRAPPAETSYPATRRSLRYLVPAPSVPVIRV